MVLEVQERGRYLLGACTKCGGDLILGEEEPYCFQCGDIVYGLIEYKVERKVSEGYRSESVKKEEKFIDSRKAIIKMINEGKENIPIAESLGLSRREVNEVRLVLRDEGEIKS